MVNLLEVSTRPPSGWDGEKMKGEFKDILEELDDLQTLLYAEGKHSVLVILQGQDASGKDGAIKKVFGSMNPQGVAVKSFKAPTEEELSHDFLWRIHSHAPARGQIQIFNRSHYEDVLVTRVHKWIDDATAYARMEAINAFEQLLEKHNNTLILKFYLHISEEEQLKRLNERLTNPKKLWKSNSKDFEEARLWPEYRKVYEDCFNRCSPIPWNVIPADDNRFKEFMIATILKKALTSLKMEYPTASSR